MPKVQEPPVEELRAANEAALAQERAALDARQRVRVFADEARNGPEAERPAMLAAAARWAAAAKAAEATAWRVCAPFARYTTAKLGGGQGTHTFQRACYRHADNARKHAAEAARMARAARRP